MVKSSLCAILVSLLIYALERRVKLMKELDRRCTRHMIRSLGSTIVAILQVRDGEVFTEHGKVYS